DCHLIELHIAAAGGRKRGDLLPIDRGEIGEEGLDITISARVGEVAAAIEMHGGRRRHRNLRRHPRDVAQEDELVERQRPGTPDAGRRVWRGELDLVAVIVVKAKRCRPDGETIEVLDEASPVRRAPEFAVGDDLKPGVLLKPYDVADCVVPDAGKSF